MTQQTLYIDGNNVIGSLSMRGRGKDDREWLLNRLLTYNLPKRCVIVFDGPSPSQGKSPDGGRGGISVRYCGIRKADDYIKERVRRGDTVVTADGDLAHSCKTLQAKIVHPREFMSCLRPKGSQGSEKPSASSREEIDMWMEAFSKK